MQLALQRVSVVGKMGPEIQNDSLELYGGGKTYPDLLICSMVGFPRKNVDVD